MPFSVLQKVKKISFLQWMFFNFVVMAIAGVLLRYMHCFPVVQVNYQFAMHGHSHFALSGWLFLAMVYLVIKQVSGNHLSVEFKAILISTIICSYGMLISFFLLGYKPLSILFSTLFVVIGYWFVYSFYRKKHFEKLKNPAAVTFCKTALWFLVFSSLGPFLLGYLGVTGYNNKVLLQNCVYFYLHFQINGWLQLLVLALFFSRYISSDFYENSEIKRWVYIFIASVVPVFMIFTLWSKPNNWFYVIAALGALLHMISWFMLLNKIKNRLKSMSLLLKIAMLAISLKVVLQVMVCVPVIGEWTFFNRNLIIGYVHLITLGALTPMIFDLLSHMGFLPSTKQMKYLHVFYMSVTCFYLFVLFIQPFLLLFGVVIPYIEKTLLLSTALLLLAGMRYFSNRLIYLARFRVYVCKLIFRINNVII